MENQLTLRQETQITRPDPAAVAAAEAAKTRIQAAYQMAAYRPRSQEQARQNLLNAMRRPKAAQVAEYRKPIKNKGEQSFITGPSIRFAELALREWGNILSDIAVVNEDEWTRRVKVTLTDLETNTSFTKELSISKTVERKFANDREVVSERTNTKGEKVFVVKATDDEIQLKEAAAISKAVRNEGLRLIPGDIIEEAIEMARNTNISETKADPDAAKRKLVDAFGQIGVKVKDLEVYLSHPIDSIQPAEVASLRTIYSSIKDGEARWQDYIQSPSDEIPAATPAATTAAMSESIKKRGRPRREEQPVAAAPAPASSEPDVQASIAEMTQEARPEGEQAPAQGEMVLDNGEPQAVIPVVDQIRGALESADISMMKFIAWAKTKKLAEPDCQSIEQIPTQKLDLIAKAITRVISDVKAWSPS